MYECQICLKNVKHFWELSGFGCCVYNKICRSCKSQMTRCPNCRKPKPQTLAANLVDLILEYDYLEPLVIPLKHLHSKVIPDKLDKDKYEYVVNDLNVTLRIDGTYEHFVDNIIYDDDPYTLNCSLIAVILNHLNDENFWSLLAHMQDAYKQTSAV